MERHWGVRYGNNWQEVLKSEGKKVQATENCQAPSSMPTRHESRKTPEVPQDMISDGWADRQKPMWEWAQEPSKAGVRSEENELEGQCPS